MLLHIWTFVEMCQFRFNSVDNLDNSVILLCETYPRSDTIQAQGPVVLFTITLTRCCKFPSQIKPWIWYFCRTFCCISNVTVISISNTHFNLAWSSICGPYDKAIEWCGLQTYGTSHKHHRRGLTEVKQTLLSSAPELLQLGCGQWRWKEPCMSPRFIM